MLEAYASAWSHFLEPNFLLWMFSGMLVGIIVGVIPAIGAMFALTVFLPFVFFLGPYQVLPFMAALLAVVFTGGCITSIVIGVPGTSGSIATILDGYKMAQKGEAGRAIGAGVTSSGMGNIYTALFALGMVPLVIPLVMNIGSPELVFLMLWGILLISQFGTAGAAIKSAISGFSGLVLSLVGYHIVTAATRYTFSTTYLYDGISVVPVFMGVFALAEMMRHMMLGGTVARRTMQLAGWKGIFQGCRDVFRHWRLNLVSSIIGYIIGIIPAIGGSVSQWVAYGQAKMASKHPEKFGTGYVAGVIAPESANNATEGGAMLTTLALGVPGSAPSVLVIAAFIMLGMVPGPRLLIDHLDLSLTLLLTIGVAGVIAAIICLVAAPQLAKIAYTPIRILAPLVLVVVLVATYADDQLFPDLITIVIFGWIGLAMHQFGYSRPAFVMGFVLGSLFEKYLFISLMARGNLFFLKPGALVIIGLIVITLGYRPIWRGLRSLFRTVTRRGVPA